MGKDRKGAASSSRRPAAKRDGAPVRSSLERRVQRLEDYLREAQNVDLDAWEADKVASLQRGAALAAEAEAEAAGS